MRGTIRLAVFAIAVLAACNSPLDIDTPRMRTVPEVIPDSSSLVNGNRLSLALVFDESASMQGFGVEAARLGGLRLTDYLDSASDEATVLAFGSTVRVLQGMTAQVPLLRASISGLTPVGATALWDAVLIGLQEVVNNGLNQHRALIVFSDGADNASSSGDNLDFISTARLTNVTISTIAFGAEAPVDKLKLVADSTGGRFEVVTTTTGAEAAYLRILRDLRSGVKIR
jgi:uncharacterized protein YegL